MRQFKHKKTGEIAREFPDYYKTSFWNTFNDIPKRLVENSDDWQEVIEKDYEILSFYNNMNNSYYKFSYVNYKYATFNVEDTHCAIGCRDFDYCLKYYQINSVRRLSDGKVFTIGDIVGEPCFAFPIKQFKLCNEECTILISSYNKLHGSGNYNTRLKDLKKVKQPLFTTEDGVDIFEGDSYCKVNNQSDYSLVTGFIAEGAQDNYRGLKFSTKEKAEEYILMNKPCLSLNDLLENVPSRGNIMGEYLSNLKEVVKNRIK